MTTELKNEVVNFNSAVGPHGRNEALVMRLQQHLRQMAPHVAARKTAQLLSAATDRIVELETVLRMVKDNDIARFMRTGEYGNGELVRTEIQRVLGA